MRAHEGMTEQDFNQLFKLAQNGDVKAQYETGLALRNGWGTKADSTQAFEWVRKAAENGDAEAMCTLGPMYLIGDTGVRDYEKAKTWCANSVIMGYPQCAVCVNEIYIAHAIEEGNLEEAQKQYEVRKEVWNTPLTSYRLEINIVELFFNKLQDLISKRLPEGAFPPHTKESVKRERSGNLWYQININSHDIIACVFEDCRKDKPPFLAIAFYASKHGAPEDKVNELLKKYQDIYAFKDEGENFGLALLIATDENTFLNAQNLELIAERVVKLYSTIYEFQKLLSK